MKKTELIEAVIQQMQTAHGRDVSKAETDAFLESLGDVTATALAVGDEVTLPGLGKLSTSQRAERQGRNPSTGEAITIPAAKVAKFSAAKGLKEAINQ